MSHICTNISLNMGLSQKDLQFKSWCPYCDTITIWQIECIHDDSAYCTCCNWQPKYGDHFPKGLDSGTGELELK